MHEAFVTVECRIVVHFGRWADGWLVLSSQEGGGSGRCCGVNSGNYRSVTAGVTKCLIIDSRAFVPAGVTKWLLKYGPVTMIVPASGHQVCCIPWVQLGTFNKEIAFLCGLKFFALNIFCGEYLQSSLHLMLQIWWKPLFWKMCQ